MNFRTTRQAKATAAGLTLEAWLKQLAGTQEEPCPTSRPLQTAADIILDCMREVPPEITATMPTDGASQHDHYICGWPKREFDRAFRRHRHQHLKAVVRDGRFSYPSPA